MATLEEIIRKRKETEGKGNTTTLERILVERNLRTHGNNSKAIKGYNDWIGRVNASRDKYIEDAKSRADVYQPSNLFNSYADTTDAEIRALAQEGQKYREHFQKYGDLYGADMANKIRSGVDDVDSYLHDLSVGLGAERRYWEGFTDLEDFNTKRAAAEAAKKEAEEYAANKEKYKAYDFAAGEEKATYLKGIAERLADIASKERGDGNTLVGGGLPTFRERRETADREREVVYQELRSRYPELADYDLTELNNYIAQLGDEIEGGKSFLELDKFSNYGNPRSEYYDPNFEQYAKYDPSRLDRISYLNDGFNESYDPYAIAYHYINSSEDVKHDIMNRYANANGGDTNSNVIQMRDWLVDLNNMSEEQKKNFNYLYSYTPRYAIPRSGEKRRVERYTEYILPEIENIAEYKFGQAHPFLASLLSMAYTPLSGVEVVADTAKYLGNVLIDPNNAKMDSNSFAEDKGILMQGVSDTVDWNIGGWDAFDFLYNTGMSGVDSAVASFIPGGYMLLGLSEAANGVNDGLERGMSDGQALANGVFRGIFEALFEKISIGNLNSMKPLTPKTLKQLGKEMVKSMGVNASEEALTELANITYDIIANGELSQLQQLVGSGKSYLEAIGELGLQVLESGASGALMGMGFSGAASGVNSAVNTFKQNNIGKGIVADGKAQDYISRGLELPDTKAFKYAEAAKAKLDKGKSANVRIGKLAQNLSDSQMISSFRAQLGEKSGDIAETLTDLVKGREVSNKAIRSILQNETALSMLNESFGTSFTADSKVEDVNEGIKKGFETPKTERDKIVDTLKKNVDSKGVNAYADTIEALQRGEVVSDKEINAFLKNPQALAALNEITGEAFTKKSATNTVRKAMVKDNMSRAGRAIEFGTTLDIGANGLKGLVSVANHSSGSMANIAQAYNAIYQAAKQGKAITDAKNPYLAELNAAQKLIAYEYGVMDSLEKKAEEEKLETSWTKEETENKADKKVDEAVEDTVPEGGEKLKSGEVVVPVKEMTKEQSDLVEAGKKLGIEVIVASIKKQGKNIDGLYNGKALYVNPDPTSGNPLVTILKHELTHFLEKNTKNTEYSAFATAVTDSKAFHKWLKDKGFKNTQEYLAEIVRNYKLVGKNYAETDPEPHGEMIANFVGDVLFAEDNSLERFVNELTEEKKKTFGDFIRDFINWIKGIFGKTDEVRMLEKKYAELFGSEKMPTESKETQLLFVGEKSNIADKIKLATAKQMLESGSDSETVRRETGWFKGYDGKWRFEIDDSDMEYSRHGFNPDYLRYKELELKFLEGTISDSELQELQKTPQDVKNINLFRLDQFVKHKALFDAYPELKRVKVSFDSNMADNGAFYPETFSIKINPKADDVRKTLLHEIQHAVQHIEEFATGGSLNSNISAVEKVMNIMGLTEDQKKIATISTLSKYSENVKRPVYDKLLKLSNQNGYQTVKEYIESLNAYSYYERIAGEIEARDVANRADMIAEERKNTRPDIDREDVVFADGVTYYKADAQKSKNTKTTEEEDEDVTSIKEQLREASDRLSLMTPISSKQSPRTFANAEETLKWAVDVLKSSGEIIQRKDYGDVILDEKRLKNGLSYLKTDMEKVAFSLVPKIIKNGIEIGRHPRHKGRNYDTITFASPVTVGDTTGYMAVVIREEGKKYYKLHRVFMPDGSLFVFQDKKRSNAETAGLQYANLSPTNGASNPIIPQNSNLSTPSDKNISEKEDSSYSYTPTKEERISALVDQFEGGLITREQFEEQLIGKDKDDPISNARLTEEDATTTPDIKRKTGEVKGDGERDTVISKGRADIFSEEFKKEVETDDFIQKYKTITNEETLRTAADELDREGNEGVQNWLALKPERASVVDIVKGFILLDRYRRLGHIEGQVRVAQKISDMGTAAGQAVQSFTILRRLDAAAMLAYSQRSLDNALKAMSKARGEIWLKKHADRFKLNDEDIDFILNRSILATTLPDGRDKDILISQIAQRIQDKLPPEKGDSAKALQRISMLFNPKTIIRNVAGNVSVAPVHYVSDWIGTAADALIGKKTGVRTTSVFTPVGENAKALARGAYESFDDFRKKVNTQANLDRFDVRSAHGKAFDEHGKARRLAQALNAMDRLTSFALAVGDRPFYEYWFTRSINAQKRTNKVAVPTAEMIEIATQEALQRTWQDDNGFTKFVGNLKRVLNTVNIKGYGLGDVLIKFTKTPANIAKAIYDLSPVAAISVTKNAVALNRAIKSGKDVAVAQKTFVKSFSNAVAGTMLYTLMIALFNAGLLTGGSDDDKDVAAFEKWVQGVPSYSINLGGRWFSYEWMQPIGAAAAIVSDFMEAKEVGTGAWDSIVLALKSGGNVFTNQSFLQSFQRLFSADTLWDGVLDTLLSDPSAWVPQILSQFANLFDDKRRVTYDKASPLRTFYNSFAYKIPGLRNTLTEDVDVFGRTIPNSQANIGNAFFNPANTYVDTSDDVTSHVYELYKALGDKAMIPAKAPYSITVGKESIPLTAEERAEYQRIMGGVSYHIIEQLIKSDFYNSYSDDEKDTVIRAVYSYASKVAQASYKADYTYDMALKDNIYMTRAIYDAMSDEDKQQAYYNGVMKSYAEILNADEKGLVTFFELKGVKDAVLNATIAYDSAKAIELMETAIEKSSAYADKEEEEKAIKSGIRSTLTSYWKPHYKVANYENDREEMDRILNVLYETGLYGNRYETRRTIQKWLEEEE